MPGSTGIHIICVCHTQCVVCMLLSVLCSFQQPNHQVRDVTVRLQTQFALSSPLFQESATVAASDPADCCTYFVTGNTLGEASVNLGHLVIAHTGEGARAVAGSRVHHSAEEGRGVAVASQTAAFRPGTVRNGGSVAFTDVSHTSAAVNGMGNGECVLPCCHEQKQFSACCMHIQYACRVCATSTNVRLWCNLLSKPTRC